MPRKNTPPAKSFLILDHESTVDSVVFLAARACRGNRPFQRARKSRRYTPI
jgi:hypothetical protein